MLQKRHQTSSRDRQIDLMWLQSVGVLWPSRKTPIDSTRTQLVSEKGRKDRQERAQERESARARERKRKSYKERERESDGRGIVEGRSEPVPSRARPKMSLHATCKRTACYLQEHGCTLNAWVCLSDVLMLVYVCILRLWVVLLACHPIFHSQTMECFARFPV